MEPTQISATPVLFTGEECQMIVGNMLRDEEKEGTLVSFSTETNNRAFGYMGEYYDLLIKYQIKNDEHEHQRRLFLKSIPYRNPKMCETMRNAGVFAKEAAIYRKLLTELRKFSPKIWCPKFYLDKPYVFAIENIEDLGYEKIGDETKFFNKLEIQTVLKTLAVMHASSLAFEEKHKSKIGDLYRNILHEVKVTSQVAWYTASVKAVLAVTQKHNLYFAEALQHFNATKLPILLKDVYEMVNPSSKYRNVFCHRDIWAGNIFLAKTDTFEKCAVFVDFQLSRYSPPAIDVLMALYLNTRPKERKLIQEECYKFYYEQFFNELANMGLSAENFMTYEQFMESIKDLTLFGTVYNCIAATSLRVPLDYLRNLRLYKNEDFDRYTNVDRTETVLKLMETNSDYKSYLFECIEDMMEYIYNDYYYMSSLDVA